MPHPARIGVWTRSTAERSVDEFEGVGPRIVEVGVLADVRSEVGSDGPRQHARPSIGGITFAEQRRAGLFQLFIRACMGIHSRRAPGQEIQRVGLRVSRSDPF